MSVQMFCKRKFVMDDKTIAFEKGKVYEFTRSFVDEDYQGVSEVDDEHYLSPETVKKHFIAFKGFKGGN